jgi:hypothetical protein
MATLKQNRARTQRRMEQVMIAIVRATDSRGFPIVLGPGTRGVPRPWQYIASIRALISPLEERTIYPSNGEATLSKNVELLVRGWRASIEYWKYHTLEDR